MKRLHILISILILNTVSCWGQNGNITLKSAFGDNTYFGKYYQASLEGSYTLPRYFQIRGGVRYTSFPQLKADLRPAFFHDFSFGRFIMEAHVQYTLQSSTENYCAGIGAGLQMRHVWFMAGYYYRTFSAIGYSDRIVEPANLLYEIGVSCLPGIRNWDLFFQISNSELLDMERAYQPTFKVEGAWYPTAKIGISLGAGYKPAGIFNMSSNYYQSFLNLGVSYKW